MVDANVNRDQAQSETGLFQGASFGLSYASVFVVGGAPEVTFVERDKGNPEQDLRDFLEAGGAFVSIQGATKCGKTVLCRRVLPRDEHVWIDGGAIRTEEQLWRQILSELNVPTNKIVQESETERTEKAIGLAGNGILSKILDIAPVLQRSDIKSSNTGTSSQYEGDLHRTSIRSLLSSGKTLVIDDFHLIPEHAHRGIVTALKQPLFDGLRVVLISIPERGFDAARAVSDMSTRINPVMLGLWDEVDLRKIGEKGFAALNVDVSPSAIRRFAKEAHGSPHLMQFFCRELCRVRGVRRTRRETEKLRVPRYELLFNQIAARAPDHRVEVLLSLGEGKKFALRNGRDADVYELILMAVKMSPPFRTKPIRDIYAKMRALCVSPPYEQQVMQALEKMAEMADKHIEGAPVLYLLRDRNELLVEDPFFAFHVKWGDWFEKNQRKT